MEFLTLFGMRGHHNRWPIFWTNLLMGWTVIGWVVAFIWATSAIRKEPA
jgi:hypothetical protein